MRLSRATQFPRNLELSRFALPSCAVCRPSPSNGCAALDQVSARRLMEAQGSSFGPTSACIPNTFWQWKQGAHLQTWPPRGVACYEIVCTGSGGLSVKVGNNFTVCPEGQTVDLERFGFEVLLLCMMCSQPFCHHTCPTWSWDLMPSTKRHHWPIEFIVRLPCHFKANPPCGGYATIPARSLQARPTWACNQGTSVIAPMAVHRACLGRVHQRNSFAGTTRRARKESTTPSAAAGVCAGRMEIATVHQDMSVKPANFTSARSMSIAQIW